MQYYINKSIIYGTILYQVGHMIRV
uniref:Uncharacterized protein n=1 Tax=Anguilla anguilla TaxID=7936 RepID=A0A0E9QXV4_ANGAN